MTKFMFFRNFVTKFQFFSCNPLTKFSGFFPKSFDNFFYVFMESAFMWQNFSFFHDLLTKVAFFFFCNAVTKLATKFTIFSRDTDTKKSNLYAERRNKMAFRHKDSQTKISLFADIFILCMSVTPAINYWFHIHPINQF